MSPHSRLCGDILVWVETSRTAVACRWSQPKTSAVEELTAASKSTVMLADHSSAGAQHNANDADRQYLFQRHSAINRFTGAWWVLSPKPTIQSHPHMLDKIVQLSSFNAADDKISFVMQKIKSSEHTRKEITKITLGQRENSLWHKYRKTRLTASNSGITLKELRETGL